MFGAWESSCVFEACVGSIREAVDCDEAILAPPSSCWQDDSIAIGGTACRERLLAMLAWWRRSSGEGECGLS